MSILSRIAGFVKGIFTRQGFIARLAGGIKTKVGSIFEILFGTSSFLLKVAFIFQTLMGLVSAIFSLILLFNNLGMIRNLISGVTDNTDTFLDKLVNIFSQYPNFNTLIGQMDSAMVSLQAGTYFRPAVTFTSIINTFGIGEAFNTIMSCALQGVAFVISIRLLMWSLSRLKLTITRPLS